MALEIGKTGGEFIQVTGEFEKREAIEFCIKDLNQKRVDFGVCQENGKFFVARAVVPDEKIGAKSNIITLRSDRVDIYGNARGIIRKGDFNFVEWYSNGKRVASVHEESIAEVAKKSP